MATISNQTFDLGETWVLDATCHDAAGNVLDVSLAAIDWRLATLQGVPVIDAGLGSGITFVNGGGDGEILITIAPDMQSAAGLSPGNYAHQCRVTLPGNVVSDQFSGSFVVLPTLFSPPVAPPAASSDAQAVIDDTYETFGHAAIYTPPTGGVMPCTVLLDLRDANAQLADGRPLAGQSTIEVRKSEIALPLKGGVFAFTDLSGTARSVTVANRPILGDEEGLTWKMWAE